MINIIHISLILPRFALPLLTLFALLTLIKRKRLNDCILFIGLFCTSIGLIVQWLFPLASIEIMIPEGNVLNQSSSSFFYFGGYIFSLGLITIALSLTSIIATERKLKRDSHMEIQ